MGNVSPDASAHLVTRSGKIDSGNRKLFSGLLLWDCRRIIDGTKPIYLTVVLPAIIPQLLSGFRIGIALAFAITVAAEFMGAEYGLGYLIMQASRTSNTEVVIIGILIIGLEAFLLETLLKVYSDYITGWTEKE